MSRYTFTSESVSEGHPDKVCDYISDSILDACLEQDASSRVACETLCKSDTVVIAGEITTSAKLDYDRIVRQAVTATTSQSGDQGAGDQGIMFGYATDESPEMMPLPILLAHKLTRGLTEDRKQGKVNFLRPDSKSQVSILYENNEPKEVTAVVISTQHTPDANQKQITDYVREQLGPRMLGSWWRKDVTLYVNPTGDFSHGGPSADAGVTGRKIIVDSYGGWGRHGGGGFSGKDPSKVDRSACYYARFIAKNIMAAKLARRCEVQLAYAIGVAQPVSIHVTTFGTGAMPEEKLDRLVREHFDCRPGALIRELDLLRPIYQQTAAYGHFGRP